MEQRKLIKLGNSSFAIALPKEWVDKSGLKKGENVFVEESNNGEIRISSSFEKKEDGKTKTIDFSNIKDEKEIKREISVAYVKDNSLIEVIGAKDKKQQAKIKELLSYFIGLEIVEESENKISAKDFFDLKEANISNFVKRIDNNIRSMFEDLGEGIKTNKIVHKHFLDADHDINKFYFLINKILIKGINNPSVLSTLNIDIMSLFNSWWLAYNLEHIGDEIKRLASIIKQSGLESKKSQEVHQALIKIKEYYINSINSYYKNDKEMASKNMAKRDETTQAVNVFSNEREADMARIGEKMKMIIGTVHQANKIILYSL